MPCTVLAISSTFYAGHIHTKAHSYLGRDRNRNATTKKLVPLMGLITLVAYKRRDSGDICILQTILLSYLVDIATTEYH